MFAQNSTVVNVPHTQTGTLGILHQSGKFGIMPQHIVAVPLAFSRVKSSENHRVRCELRLKVDVASESTVLDGSDAFLALGLRASSVVLRTFDSMKAAVRC